MGAILHLMDTANTAYYAALLSRDRKFDGRFFVGVSSTKIYCRPICTVRTPKLENCSFYPSAVAAELNGYRPCLKCRPELAPGLSPIDASGRYVQVAVKLIESGFLSDHSCEELAARLGISDRHLRRTFAEQFGASPIEFAQSQRLLQAKRLLTDTDISLAEIALAAGFGSLRRFNELFREHYRLTPSDLRSQRRSGKAIAPSSLTLRLAYRPSYDWDWMLDFLRIRAVDGIEKIIDNTYIRTLCVTQSGIAHLGWIRITPMPNKSQISVEISASLLRVVPEVLLRVRRLFDLDAMPEQIAAALGSLSAVRPGLRLPGSVSGFEFAVRAILEQQISTKAAATLASRFTERFGVSIETPFEGIRYIFPDAASIATLSIEALRSIGMTAKRAVSIQSLSALTAEGKLDLDYVVDIDRGIETLTELPGIGLWTATYIAMRAWSWADAFLHTDYVIRQRFPMLSPKQIQKLAERWRPWRSYAVFHLWHGVSEDQLKIEQMLEKEC
ncbi:MAG: DNA-3-methyladenine glycosylase 2 [Pseudomonadota bacterium]